MIPEPPPAIRPLLRVDGLRTRFGGTAGGTLAVDGLSLELSRGEALALVGESGCGKSATLLAILGLVPAPGRVEAGRVELDGEDLRAAAPERLRRLRGRLGVVFQDPGASLDPVVRVGEQIVEVLRVHRGLDRRAAAARSVELLRAAGLPASETGARAYPHELSGGMRQRAAMALALACDPELLLADEPTTALDPVLASQLLDLLERERRTRGLAMLLVTHDPGVVARTCDRAAVMYRGRVVEQAPVRSLFARPVHPYTAVLLARSAPQSAGAAPGMLPTGCRYRDRCDRAGDDCAEEPSLEPLADFPGHAVACRHPLPAP